MTLVSKKSEQPCRHGDMVKGRGARDDPPALRWAGRLSDESDGPCQELEDEDASFPIPIPATPIISLQKDPSLTIDLDLAEYTNTTDALGNWGTNVHGEDRQHNCGRAAGGSGMADVSN